MTEKRDMTEFISEFTGDLKRCSEVGGYGLIYINAEYETLCPDCAIKYVNSYGIGELLDAFIHWEGNPLYCDHCGEEMEAEYGEIAEYRRFVKYLNDFL